RTSSTISLQTLRIGLQTSQSPSHQILTRIFAIFLSEILNIRNVSIVPLDNPVAVLNDISYEEKKLRTTLNMIKFVRQPGMSMINLEVWMPSLGHAVVPSQVYEAGVSTLPGRFAWFISKVPSDNNKEIWHYSIFSNSTSPLYQNFLMVNDVLSSLSRGEEYELYISPLCQKFQCVVLIAEHRSDSAFVEHQIEEMNAYVNVLWLGPYFRFVVKFLLDLHLTSSKKFLVLHWKPSDISSVGNWDMVTMPPCEYFQSLIRSFCKYELTPIIKYYHKSLANEYRLMHALRFFFVDDGNMQTLLSSINREFVSAKKITEGFYDDLACNWLKNNSDIYNSWVSRKRITLSIGGIFPITKISRGHQNLLQAVRRAVKVINANTSILSEYDLIVHENDGECKADMVMNMFIQCFSIPRVLGVLGPACSETVEPIAGISRHTNMAVISYSAEGASFVDRQAYPFFFRTIGSNYQYEDVYIKFMQQFGWRRAAAVTEDGQKYGEYMSHMETVMKDHGLELVVNKKFLNDITYHDMNEYLQDLKRRRVKVIIADVHNKLAQMVLCEAYKLKMTAYEGYVWFLPFWLSKDWITHGLDTYVNCTIQELEQGFEGHFSMMHRPFGNESSLMQENISIKEWLSSYRSDVLSVSQYTAFAYDAVWVYALAAEKLLLEDKTAVDNLRSKRVVKRFVDFIWQTDFEGLSGRVRFDQGGSRLTDIVITQWCNNQSNDIGEYHPKIVKSNGYLKADGGDLVLYESSRGIQWFSIKKPPDDGRYECNFSSLVQILNIECENAVTIFTALMCSLLALIVTLLSFLFWKRRYDSKLKRSAKIMKNFGIDIFSPSRSIANTLDKWELPKQNIVINRRLGEGAFGTVYGGEALINSENWTAVAVKTLKLGASTEDRLDFLSEAEAMKRFNHKNIVKLLGVCLQSEPIYTIMEYMLYGDLKTYLLARRHLATETICDESDISSKRLTMFALNVSQGLDYLAQQKYVHRDIACRNCLVNAKRIVKIGDFGMARPTYESDYYRFNRKGMLPVRWMAPESLALGMFTPASDVWGYGIVLFEIITFGSFPYQGLTNNQVLKFVKDGKTLQIPAGAKPQLEGLIKACWNRNPKKRPEASEIAKYITSYPRLLTPCLDFPSASIEMANAESDDQLEFLPTSLQSPPQRSYSSFNVVEQATTPEKIKDSGFVDVDNLPEVICDTSNDPNTYSPTTPDGYSIMSPLLVHHISSSISETPT
uniref:receptor protein-tyrosine kinase n=1 Tax=Glossina brevipalpis TaxID=37001 RepID=A0A1A9WXE3_9MUSC